MNRNVSEGFSTVLVLALSSSLWGCSNRPTEPSDGPVRFANDIQPILTSSCASSGCHGSNAEPPEKPMVLLAGQAYDNIVGVSSAQLATMLRIRPGEPDNSYLVHKIQGTQGSVGGSGERMPLGQGPLSQSTIALIRRWVTEGAPRN